MKRNGEKIKQAQHQLMPDVNHSFNDANLMYEFMANKVCMEVSDITIMCDKSDYYRLLKKPQYEGDLLRQMFDWNLNKEAALMENKAIREAVQSIDLNASWESFESEVSKFKYRTKYEARVWKRKEVDKMLVDFKKGNQSSFAKDLKNTSNMIKCEDFWKKREDPRREQLFRKMQPLIFLKQQLPAY